MDRRMEVLGIQVADVRAAEALTRTQEFLATESLNTVEILTTKMLLEAGENEAYKEIIEQLDMTVLGDKKILEVAEIIDGDYSKEIDNMRYLRGLFRYADYEGLTFVLLCETQEEKESLQTYMNRKFSDIKVPAAFSMDELGEDIDSLINNINGKSPDVIVAMLAVPEQELFLAKVRGKLNARLWLGIGEVLKTAGALDIKQGFIKKMIENRIFKKRVVEYQQEKGDS